MRPEKEEKGQSQRGKKQKTIKKSPLGDKVTDTVRIPDGRGIPQTTIIMGIVGSLDNKFCLILNRERINRIPDQGRILFRLYFSRTSQILSVYFCGAPEGNEIFHVAAGGMLTLSGLTVTSEVDAKVLAQEEKYVLRQEEGAGLIVDNCSVSGNIRYAKTPFVMYKSSLTVIAENGQEASGVLPSVITGQVNRQGQVFYREEKPVSWDLAGTEKLQQERRRFTIKGTFQGAAATELPECTVVYNDFPLTFTKVEASVSQSVYSFRGNYTKPDELPIMLSREYSFDNKNWMVYEVVESVSDAGRGFFIGLTTQEWDISVHPYVYIRLRGEHDGTESYSNVLRYAAHDLSRTEDLGGQQGRWYCHY